ncbi:GH24 family phage-related lysozyme (muramidase) [Rhizobium leguminosarum]|uniref:Lysozyme n=2 Tax=Rhizobium leguminosarum TaxID=384 RepID=A0ABF7QJ81_RHILW|nr:lysozyme [Rhizobium leguminosarum]ACI54046.1 glycoside hydrolase family 24 [Rhizobium leguminosarum bv. trifolii WSM2304]NYJ15157.1 GH24 family phage-related lysozyme (muramidase) [Rhizobium leguminosarum]
MPINKIRPSKRAAGAIAAALVAAATGGWHSIKDTSPTVHPPAVILAKDALISTWEGIVLEAHYDPYAKIYDICFGKTRLNGKPIRKGMKFTREECEDFLETDLFNEYYLPLTKQVPQYVNFPLSVQAAQLSGAYNFGVGGMVLSKAMDAAKAGKWREACEKQTAWNRAGGQVVRGLVLRREMGDAQRIGEAELCVSGI